MSDSPPPIPQASPRHPFGRLIGMRFDEVAAGVSRAHLDVRDELFNPAGVLHGGAVFSLADTGMGAALYSLLKPGESCATVEMKMNFLKPVTKGRVDCETIVLRRGRTTAVMESKVRVGEDLVAVALGTYAIFPLTQPLPK